MNFLYAKLNKQLKNVDYKGAVTDTVAVDVDLAKKEISANVIKGSITDKYLSPDINATLTEVTSSVEALNAKAVNIEKGEEVPGVYPPRYLIDSITQNGEVFLTGKNIRRKYVELNFAGGMTIFSRIWVEVFCTYKESVTYDLTWLKTYVTACGSKTNNNTVFILPCKGYFTQYPLSSRQSHAIDFIEYDRTNDVLKLGYFDFNNDTNIYQTFNPGQIQAPKSEIFSGQVIS